MFREEIAKVNSTETDKEKVLSFRNHWRTRPQPSSQLRPLPAPCRGDLSSLRDCLALRVQWANSLIRNVAAHLRDICGALTDSGKRDWLYLRNPWFNQTNRHVNTVILSLWQYSIKANDNWHQQGGWLDVPTVPWKTVKATSKQLYFDLKKKQLNDGARA